MAAAANVDYVSDKNICLILLVGLPGSGKTFLTNFLVDLLSSVTPIKHGIDCFVDSCVVPITYDDYIIYDDKFDYIKDWKWKRKTVFSSVEEFILYFKGIKSMLDDNLYNINNKHFQNYSRCIEHKNLFIIIDDNMYYKSMRFEYFKLARKHKTGFCQLFLDTTLEKALACNRKRVNIVPEVIISKMHMKIERPNPSVNNWEHNSVIIPAYIDFNDDSILNKLHNVIKLAVGSPENYKNLESKQSNVNECKAITDTSLLHQIDLRLRNLVNNRIKEIKQNQQFHINKLKFVADELNSRRLQLMKEVKNNVLILPIEVINILQNSDKTIDNDKLVNSYLLNLFVNDLTD